MKKEIARKTDKRERGLYTRDLKGYDKAVKLMYITNINTQNY